MDLDVAALLHQALVLVLKMCAPLLLAPLLSGLVVAVLQATTQISDSSLSFVPKLLSTGAALWLTGPYLFQALADFTRAGFDHIIAIGTQ